VTPVILHILLDSFFAYSFIHPQRHWKTFILTPVILHILPRLILAYLLNHPQRYWQTFTSILTPVRLYIPPRLIIAHVLIHPQRNWQAFIFPAGRQIETPNFYTKSKWTIKQKNLLKFRIACKRNSGRTRIFNGYESMTNKILNRSHAYVKFLYMRKYSPYIKWF
jgi:hypothetical protein